MEQYCKDVLKVAVAQICQTIGWHGIQSSALEIMIDITHRYLLEMCKHSHRYAELYGMTEPNLDHVALMMRELHINLAELEEYVNWVEPMPLSFQVPKIPVSKEDHLRFLKPGSREVLTRPVHVPEHLPPMYPELEVEDNAVPLLPKLETPSSPTGGSLELSTALSNPDLTAENIFKRPGDPISESQAKKARTTTFGEEGRPTREISSVMMTSSGFLSPAREGKLPEARTPHTIVDAGSPPATYPVVPPEIRLEKKIRKTPTEFSKKKDNLLTKELLDKELFKPDPAGTTPEISGKMKKILTPKDLTKTKLKGKNTQFSNLSSQMDAISKIASNQATTITKLPQNDKTRVTPPIMTKPIKIEDPPMQPMAPPPLEPGVTIIEIDDQGVRKLSNEPDKVKLNIFKKISSKSKDDKNDKTDKTERKTDSHFDFHAAASTRNFHAVDIIPINEPVGKTSKLETKKEFEKLKTPEITIKEEPLFANQYQKDRPRTPSLKHHDDKIVSYALDMSPPGTPSTPKTPEIIVETPRKLDKEKKKRKDKTKKIKLHKIKAAKLLNQGLSPRRGKFEDNFDLDIRPKTPEDPISIVKTEPPQLNPAMFSFIPQFPTGPSLIPNNLLFPYLPNALKGRPGFGQPPLMSPTSVLNLPPSISQPNKCEPEKLASPPPSTIINKIKDELELEITEVPLIPKLDKKKEHKKEKKDKLDKKIRKKKDKKDKKKGKAEKKLEREEKKEKLKIKKEKKEKHKDRLINSETSVPKLTLKLGPQAGTRVPTPDIQMSRKITIKPVVKKEDEPLPPTVREMSPELVRISALVTRPPKIVKQPSLTPHSVSEHPVTPPQPDLGFHAKLKKSMFKPIPKIKSKDLMKRSSGVVMPSTSGACDDADGAYHRPLGVAHFDNANDEHASDALSCVVVPSDVAPSKDAFYFTRHLNYSDTSRYEFNSFRNLAQAHSLGAGAEDKEKENATPLNVSTANSNARGAVVSSTLAMALASPGAATASPARTHAGPGRPRGSSNAAKAAAALAAAAAAAAAVVATPTPTPSVKSTAATVGKHSKPSSVLDKDGNKVWICPACGGQDDGSPMIGCDDCDAWYHWVCVGIQVPPDDNEDWYCKICIVKKQESIHSDKKRKRKKKEKKDKVPS